jgi:tetratricopeptide (TPR) repeat protein
VGVDEMGPSSSGPGATRSDVSGTAGDVVQARDVSGGIHIHTRQGQDAGRPRQLPRGVSGFVNRTRDLAQLDQLLGGADGQLADAGVCVIVGTPGVGKTSLSVHWAHRQASRFLDGQLYLNLQGYDVGEPLSAHEALERLLSALGVHPAAIPTDTEARSEVFRSLLADLRVLILLDNAVAAAQVRPLLPGSGGCLTLVTSRNRMSGLVARDGATRITVEVFPEHEAIQLLKTATADYRTDDADHEVAALARLCARLPLALRIAAERAAARPRMPLDELIRDLRDASSLWDALASEEDAEVDAVRSVFAWSYRALPASTARLFRLLGLHPGADFSTHAAAAITGLSVTETRRLLDGLVGAHLLEQIARDRFQFHDLLRAYALALANSEEDDGARREAVARLGAWYLSAANAATDALADPEVGEGWTLDDWGIPVQLPGRFDLPDFAGPDEALVWLDTESDNAFAVSRIAASARLDEIAWKLPVMLFGIYADRHPVRSWIPVGESALAVARRAGDRLGQVAVLIRLGVSFRLFQQVQRAIDVHTEALAIAEEIGRERVYAAALGMLGFAQVRGRRLDDARNSYQQSLAAAQRADSALWAAWAREGLAAVLYEQGELAAAAEAIDEALRDPGPNAILRADCLWVSAMILRETGQIEQARTDITGAIRIARAEHSSVSEAAFEIERGRVLLAAGEPNEALAVLHDAAVKHQQLGDRSREADALDAAGEACQVLGRLEEASDLHRRASIQHGELEDPWHQALALTNLARTVLDQGQPAQATKHLAHARALITQYDDPRAALLQTKITSMSARQ